MVEAAVGTAAWSALDLRSRHFLSTAAQHLIEWEDRADLDHSPVVVLCGKALEVELAQLVDGFRSDLRSASEHDPDDRNDMSLRGRLDGSDKLTLGSFPYLLRPKAEASPLRLDFAAYVKALPGSDVLAHRKFANSFLARVSKLRNPASHDSSTAWRDARDLFDLLLDSDDSESPLQALVGWKTPDTPTTPRPTVFELTGDHLITRRYRYWNVGEGALVDSELNNSGDTEEDESFPEFADWLVESGHLDQLVAQRHVTRATTPPASERLQTQGRAARGLTLPAGLRSRPVLERSVIEIVDPAAERQRPVGFIGSERGEVAWRIIPRMVLGRTKDGVVVLAAAVGVLGRADDLFQHTYGKETVEAVACFLADRDQGAWCHSTRRHIFGVGRQGSRAIEGLHPLQGADPTRRRTGRLPPGCGSGRRGAGRGGCGGVVRAARSVHQQLG